jgi:hypothetical protein
VRRVLVDARLVAELRRVLAALDAGFFAVGLLLASPRALFEAALLVGARRVFARALVEAAFFFARPLVEVTFFLGARLASTGFRAFPVSVDTASLTVVPALTAKSFTPSMPTLAVSVRMSPALSARDFAPSNPAFAVSTTAVCAFASLSFSIVAFLLRVTKAP